MIKRLIAKIKRLYYTSSSDRYIKYLRSKGIRIGRGTKFRSPGSVEIDTTRPELLEIGEHVFIHKGMVIMTHDWTGWCFIDTHNEFIPSHGKIKIGNNVWFGENVSVCKGVTIGDNCIIGIGAVVTKDIPANSVAAGVPAKVICSYDEYFNKRQERYPDEAVEYAKAIIDSGREPVVEDFYDDYPLFVDGSNYQNYNIPYSKVFTEDKFAIWKETHKKTFDGFDAFIQYVKSK